MSRIGLAFRVFFGVLSGSVVANRAEALLTQADASTAAPSPAKVPKTASSKRSGPQRSDAVTLLAALQREARLVDLVQEPLSEYSDSQIGAAARDVLRDCREVLLRMFQLRPVMEGGEDEMVETAEQINPGRLRVGGNVSGEPPFRGRLVHHGWEATRCELPQWSGDEEAAGVIAPAEIEC